VSEETGNRSLAAENEHMMAVARLRLGDLADAEVNAQRGVATLAEIGDVWNLSISLWCATEVATALGKFDTALDYGTRGLALARQIGAVRFTINNLLGMAGLYRELEDYHSAWQCDREAAQLAAATSGWAGWHLPWALALLAVDDAALGKGEQARAHIGEARQALAETESCLDFQQRVPYAEARVLLAAGQHAKATETAKAVVKSAVATGRLYWRVPAMLIVGDIAASRKRWADATRAYASAAEEAERVGRAPALWRALAGLAEGQEARGLKEDAAQSAGRAREIVERLAAVVPDERLRATFLQAAKVQRVMALAGG
jgi:tetratricopeptide (TPR) repeat protein